MKTNTKIGSFITALTTLVIGIVVAAICYNSFSQWASTTGTERLAFIVLLPLAFVLEILNVGLPIAALSASVASIKSNLKAIKVLAIILTVLSIALVVFAVINTKNFIKLF